MNGVELLRAQESPDLFADGPVIEDSLFDIDLARAAENPDDNEAFASLTVHFEQARESGDMSRLYQMSMTLGAMACLHDHLQEFSNEMSESFMPGQDHDHDSHEHSPKPKKDSKEHKSKKKDKAKKKSWWNTKPAKQ